MIDGFTKELPVLSIPSGASFLYVLKKAMKVARETGMDEIAMIRDVQSFKSIEERKERLAAYFKII